MQTSYSAENASFSRNLLRLAVPIVLQNLVTTAVSSADVIMLGFVSQDALAAGSLASQIMFILEFLLVSLCLQPNIGESRTPLPLNGSWESECGFPF